MVKKYRIGCPFETYAVTKKDIPEASISEFPYGKLCLDDGFKFTYKMDANDIVYGLGENMRGINKRGYKYISNNTDIPHHHEDTLSLYGSHNFIIIDSPDSKHAFGMFIDYPGKLVYDIGYTKMDELVITCAGADLDIYIIEGDSAYEIVKNFRGIIGKSYIPPKFAFGYGQSRWGYKTREDFYNVCKGYRENHIPIDMIYMDIDYMDSFKDFTINESEFPDFAGFVKEMKDENIRLIPIIDAGVKIEKGYSVYEEGVANNYFCKTIDENGETKDFTAAVWPGYTHLPDVLNDEARLWFGMKYKLLTDCGIEGFWNDMNEPALFYTPSGVENAIKEMKNFIEKYDVATNPNISKKPVAVSDVWGLQGVLNGLANNAADYASFYHNANGKMVRHDKVHNLYGYNMTKAADEGLKAIAPDKKFLLFSRSSYIGMHRHGGIWTGDNNSWWSHILLNLKMLPSLNMCGFLYIGADLGGFGENTTRDLLLRWLALGVFTPLMRNHSAFGTREQECYKYENISDFRAIINARYRLIPYLYDTYIKAAENDDMFFKPLAFVYPEDKRVRTIEDQLIIGDEIMIAPVYTQNADGRHVYLPEDMKFVKFMADGSIYEKNLTAGDHFVEVALNEVPLFIRKGKSIPICDVCECVDDIDMSTIQMI